MSNIYNRQPGKLNHHSFEEMILQRCGAERNEVSTGAAFGVDVSVIDLPNGLAMAMTSDPLSLIPSLGLQESAWLSVHLMANDMATTGFAPMYAQFVLNLPAQFSTADFQTYWNHIHQYCKEIGIAITGGHTGFIEGQNSTIAGGGTFTTVAAKEQILTSAKANEGDVILVTKQAALTATSILAMSFPETVKNNAGKDVYEKSCELFWQTSSLIDALTAAGIETKFTEVTAMHDVTEGGVLGAVYELAVASNKGVRLYNDSIPIGEVQQNVCALFGIDPRYVVGAGAMIITVKKGAEQNVIDRLKKKNIACTVIGEITAKDKGKKIVVDDKEEELIYLERDPYWHAFFNAYKKGWK
ncbi:AIR synthase [Lacibacter luteus]|uniref:AIR synthase n=1 Tax=Lacibacter luteus TaxID=2508719 RepID=A0A4Q1CID5_9BACT|nr:AIR synthase family protein [Lacibacter luteus]RXK59921.1 AIR synthase [Lacibacter luteus]